MGLEAIIPHIVGFQVRFIRLRVQSLQGLWPARLWDSQGLRCAGLWGFQGLTFGTLNPKLSTVKFGHGSEMSRLGCRA